MNEHDSDGVSGATGPPGYYVLGLPPAEHQEVPIFKIEVTALQKIVEQNDELRALCARAADALERMEVNWPNEKKGDYNPLIRKLRKAAK